jgi:AbrB family looped-hinge helix DNA binding protein
MNIMKKKSPPTTSRRKRAARPKASPGYASRLTSKYQATIPKPIREHLHLEKGDEVFYELLPDNTVIVRKPSALDLEYLKGVSNTLNEWESDEDEQAYKDL